MLTIHSLVKSFGKTRAVDDLSLEVHPGEVFGLLGPNGAGKTTTVRIACGLLQPDRGEVYIDGRGAPSEAAVRSVIGVAPQELAIYDELTGQENLEFFGRLQGLRGADLSRRTAWALDFVDLSGRRTDRAKAYSGGMKRRLNLAIALIHDPGLLLLDEPTAGVDPQSRSAILERIHRLRDEGKTVIYTTHYMEEAQKLCDRVGVIDHGHLLALGTVDELTASHAGKTMVRAWTDDGETRIETDDPLRELQALQSSGTLRRFSVDRPDLESVFLNLTGRTLRD